MVIKKENIYWEYFCLEAKKDHNNNNKQKLKQTNSRCKMKCIWQYVLCMLKSDSCSLPAAQELQKEPDVQNIWH